MSEQTKAKLRIFLADDHPVVLAGIKSLLSSDPELEIVGEARDGQKALQMAIELKPDVVILDLSMPGMKGVDVTRQLRAERPGCRVLVLTVHEDRSYLRKLIEVGAAGYVLKRSASEDLLRAIHAVTAGGIYLDPAIAGQVIDTRANGSRELAPGSELSEREIDVLRLTALGHSNKSIATIQEIGVKSVETYKARAMQKLGFHSRVQVVGYAIGQGWLAEG